MKKLEETEDEVPIGLGGTEMPDDVELGAGVLEVSRVEFGNVGR